MAKKKKDEEILYTEKPATSPTNQAVGGHSDVIVEEVVTEPKTGKPPKKTLGTQAETDKTPQQEEVAIEKAPAPAFVPEQARVTTPEGQPKQSAESAPLQNAQVTAAVPSVDGLSLQELMTTTEAQRGKELGSDIATLLALTSEQAPTTQPQLKSESVPVSMPQDAQTDRMIAEMALSEMLANNAERKSEAEKALAGAEYQKSDAVKQAQEDLEKYEEGKPADYTSTYQDRIDSLLDQILNREAFSYDFDADPLYQQYKNQYQHDGLLAMQDTMAQLQSATGGYGSSYAAAASSGAYQSYLNDLHKEMPALYDAALSVYAKEGAQMQDGLSALTQQESAAQKLYQDTLDAYFEGLSAATDKAKSAYDQDYGRYDDYLSYLSDQRDYYAGQAQQDVNNEQARLARELAEKKYQESIRQWEAERAAAKAEFEAKLAQDQAQFEASLAQKSRTSSSSSSSSSSRSSVSSTKGGSSANTSKNNDAVLDTRAQEAQQAIMREVRMVQANTSGSSDKAVENFVKQALETYVSNDVLTQEQANLIGQSYGVSV